MRITTHMTVQQFCKYSKTKSLGKNHLKWMKKVLPWTIGTSTVGGCPMSKRIYGIYIHVYTWDINDTVPFQERLVNYMQSLKVVKMLSKAIISSQNILFRFIWLLKNEKHQSTSINTRKIFHREIFEIANFVTDEWSQPSASKVLKLHVLHVYYILEYWI